MEYGMISYNLTKINLDWFYIKNQVLAHIIKNFKEIHKFVWNTMRHIICDCRVMAVGVCVLCDMQSFSSFL